MKSWINTLSLCAVLAFFLPVMAEPSKDMIDKAQQAVPVMEEPLVDTIAQTEQWAADRFDRPSTQRAYTMIKEKIDKIINGKMTDPEKQAALAKLMERPPPKDDADGDGIPDDQDTFKLVAEEGQLTWRIDSVRFGWKADRRIVEELSRINTRSSELLRSNGITVNNNQTENVNWEVEVYGKIDAKVKLSLNPWDALIPTIEGGAAAHYRKNKISEESICVSAKEQQDVSLASSLVSRVNVQKALSDPFVQFTVTFFNKGNRTYFCKDLQVPVTYKGEMTEIAVLEDVDGQQKDFKIPPGRPAGIQLRFRARLKDTVSLDMLKDLSAVRLQMSKSKGCISYDDGKKNENDVIADFQRLVEKTCLISIVGPDGKTFSFRVARQVRTEKLTAGQIIAELNKLSEGGHGVVAVDEKTGTVSSACGLDAGEKGAWEVFVGGVLANGSQWLQVLVPENIRIVYKHLAVAAAPPEEEWEVDLEPPIPPSKLYGNWSWRWKLYKITYHFTFHPSGKMTMTMSPEKRDLVPGYGFFDKGEGTWTIDKNNRLTVQLTHIWVFGFRKEYWTSYFDSVHVDGVDAQMIRVKRFDSNVLRREP